MPYDPPFETEVPYDENAPFEIDTRLMIPAEPEDDLINNEMDALLAQLSPEELEELKYYMEG